MRSQRLSPTLHACSTMCCALGRGCAERAQRVRPTHGSGASKRWSTVTVSEPAGAACSGPRAIEHWPCTPENEAMRFLFGVLTGGAITWAASLVVGDYLPSLG